MTGICAPSALAALATNGDFERFHSERMGAVDWTSFAQDLESFCRATMDLPRTNRSRDITKQLLHIIGYEDLAIFRDLVLLKEESGNIEYDGQRDHTAHTVNNYLLGWYFWTYAPPIRAALENQMQQRGVCGPCASQGFPFDDYVGFFAVVWQYASLLHDVGYLFEGGLPVLGLSNRSTSTSVGIEHVREYFETLLWRDYDVETVGNRDAFLTELGADLAPPMFDPTSSPAAAACVLRSLGSLASLGRAASVDLSETGDDAFDLWRKHYKEFGFEAMVSRTSALHAVFNHLTVRGIPGLDLRVLDHGVCSGLLQLLVSTYYYRLKTAARTKITTNPRVAKFQGLPWSPDFWWRGIVWATAATALHNIQVMRNLHLVRLPANALWPGPLPLEEDALAFLGILVDVIQCWDRYPVYPRKQRGEPVQGHEVLLHASDAKVVVTFTGAQARDRADSVRKELNRGLLSWADVVEIRPMP